MITQALKKLFRKVGFNVTRYPKGSATYDAHLSQIFHLLQINCVLDVGANQGQYGKFLRSLGYAGKIISFEPNPRDFKILQKATNQDENWTCFQYALGAISGVKQLNITSTSLFSSFLKPTPQIKNVFGGGGEIVLQENVSIKTVNEIFPQIKQGIENLHVYLKMDTQGYDMEVLAGAMDVMEYIYALESELSVKPIYENMVSYHQAVQKIEDMDFSVTGFFPVTRDHLFQIIEFTCVAININLLKPLAKNIDHLAIYHFQK